MSPFYSCYIFVIETDVGIRGLPSRRKPSTVVVACYSASDMRSRHSTLPPNIYIGTAPYAIYAKHTSILSGLLSE